MLESSASEGRTAAKGGKTGKAKTAKAQDAAPEKGAQAGKTGKRAAAPTAAKKASAPPADSKGANILALIRRPKGATLAEIMKATGGQAHSVCGLISTAAKKQGIRFAGLAHL